MIGGAFLPWSLAFFSDYGASMHPQGGLCGLSSFPIRVSGRNLAEK